MKPQTGGRWKALMESSAWRNYRRNRRKILREGCKSMDDDDAYRQIRKNALSVRVKEEGKNETDIAEKAVNKWMSIIDQTKLLSKNLLDSSNASNDGTALSQRTPKENAKDLNNSDKTSSSGEKLPEENRAENSSNSSAPPKPPVQQNNANSESSHLFGEVEALECLLGEQEDEIDEIEDELTRCKKKNQALSDDFSNKQSSLSHLENKYAKLKIDIANSQYNESELQLDVSQLVMVRDLEILNLTNEFNQLSVKMKRLEKVSGTMDEKIEDVDKSTEKNETKLSHALEELAKLKRGRNQHLEYEISSSDESSLED